MDGGPVAPPARDESIKGKLKDEDGLLCITKFEGLNRRPLISW